jgi:hypothetical protein
MRVEVDYTGLRLVDLTTGSVTELGRLNSGDDFSGWMSIHPLTEGWLYVAGIQYGSAIRVQQREGRWMLIDNLRVREHDADPLASLTRALLGSDNEGARRDHLTGLVVKRGYRFYSPALKAMLFLEDGEIFDRGRFRPIGQGPMRWYSGDVTSTPAALLSDRKGKLFAYDGQTLAPVEGPNLQGGWINRPLPTTRTFLGSGSKVFELRGQGWNELRLVELVPTDGRDIGWYRTAVPEGEEQPLFVGPRAIYALEGDRLQPIWRPDAGEYVDGPADSNRLADGKLLISTSRARGTRVASRYWLLSPCK